MPHRPTGFVAETPAPAAAPLFRAEAVNHQLDRLAGTVAVAAPISWAWIGGVLAALALMIAGMSLVSWSSGVTSRGMILPDQMTVTLASSQPGTVSEVFVATGQSVRIGDRLLTARAKNAAGIAGDHIVKATQDGVIANLRVRPGQTLAMKEPLLQIISGNGRPFAELRLSADAIGSVALGQEVHLALDAFPSQTFGTVEARVVNITPLRIERPGPAGPMFLYRVKLKPYQPWIVARGRKQALLPGMSVTARIATPKRRLLDWLTAPLSQAAGRP